MSSSQDDSPINLFSSFLNALCEPLLILDENLVIQSANQPFTELFQTSGKAVQGIPFFHLNDGEWKLPQLQKLFKEAISDQEEIKNLEIVHDFKNVGQKILQLNLRKLTLPGSEELFYLFAIEDQTEQVRLANDRLNAQKRFDSMLEQVSDYAIFMMNEDGIATTWNKGVENVLGFSEEEFIGHDVKTMIFTEDSQENDIPQWELDTAIENGTCSDDRWMNRKNGTTFWASGITTCLRDDNGKVIGFNKIMRDLTHRKDAEDAIRQLNSELSAANHHKNQFLATLAHELRNPLTPISGVLTLLDQTKELPEEVEQLCSIAGRQVEHMIRLVDDLLDISRISRGKLELKLCDCRLRPILQQAIESTHPFISDSKHFFKYELPPESICLYGDPARLAQVFTNILNNAAKYTPEGGQIDLTAKIEDESVVVSIKDNGIGMEPDKVSLAFEMFNQMDVDLERGKAGLGIGLSLVKTLVDLHDGKIELHSDGRDQGTTVSVTLKRIEVDHVNREPDLLEIPPKSHSGDQEKKSRSVRNQEDLITKRKLKVLVVDDLNAITMIMSRLIQKIGHEVAVASSGIEALDIIASNRPDVVFSDISMPEMSGYELAALCRERFPDSGMKLVALTGFGNESDRERAYEVGFDHHMVKPPDIRILRDYFEQFYK